MTTTEVSSTEPRSLLADNGDDWWSQSQLKALHHMGIESDVPQGDLAIFRHHCQRTGLDPFARQIYLIGRNAKEGDRWVKKYTIQVGVEGSRVLGDRVAAARGDSIEHEEPLWADANGVWHDVWVSDEPPVAAKYTIVKNGKRNTVTVMYREFVQTVRGGGPNSMWAKMPCNQLAQCAEVQAWKKVYPNDFAGLVAHGAATPDEGRAAERADARRVTVDEIVPADVSPPEPDADDTDGQLSIEDAEVSE